MLGWLPGTAPRGGAGCVPLPTPLPSVPGDPAPTRSCPGALQGPSQRSTLQCLLPPRLAAQSVSHVVPLFLDGEVSFLPQNSFPCSFQPFEVRWVLGAGVPEQGQGMRMLAQAGSKDCDDVGAILPPQDGECLEAQRRLVALLMAFVCSLPRNVSWWGAGWRGALAQRPPAWARSQFQAQREGAAVALGCNTLRVSSRWQFLSRNGFSGSCWR